MQVICFTAKRLSDTFAFKKKLSRDFQTRSVYLKKLLKITFLKFLPKK